MTLTHSIVSSVILRNMRTTPNFTRGDGLVPTDVALRLVSGESIVGTYRDPANDRSSLVFTDVALYVVEDRQLRRIAWADIVGYESPPKSDTRGIELRTATGHEFVPIAGSSGPEGKFKDAFHLAMVLRSLLG